MLGELGLGDFEIKLNHRGLLDAMLEVAGVPAQKFRCARFHLAVLQKVRKSQMKSGCSVGWNIEGTQVTLLSSLTKPVLHVRIDLEACLLFIFTRARFWDVVSAYLLDVIVLLTKSAAVATVSFTQPFSTAPFARQSTSWTRSRGRRCGGR